MLLTTLGGTTYAWASAQIVALGVDRRGRASLALPARRVARRRADPAAARCSATASSRITSAIGFVIGFALFGALTYLPLFQQVVRGDSPTESGLQLIPVMAGVLIGSIGSGPGRSRATGRYKVFPDRRHGDRRGRDGPALAPGRRHLDARTRSSRCSSWASGSGSSMQVLVLAVQNAVDYARARRRDVRRDAVPLDGRLARHGRARRDLHRAGSTAELAGSPAAGVAAARSTRARSQRLPAAIRDALHERLHRRARRPCSSSRAAIVVVAFLLSWLIEERPLRQTVETAGVGEAFASPTQRRLAARAHARARAARRPRAHAGVHRAHGRRRRASTCRPAPRGCSCRARRACRSTTRRRSPTAARSTPRGCASSSARSTAAGSSPARS